MIIYPGVEVDVCVLAFSGHDADSRPIGEVEIACEIAAEGQERTARTVKIKVGRGA